MPVEKSASKLQARVAELESENARLRASRDSGDLLRTFIRQMPVAAAMFDREMRYLQASDLWCRERSLDASTILGRSHYEVFSEVPGRWKDIHVRCLAGETIRSEEDRYERRDGTAVWLRWEVRPWGDRDGLPEGILIFSEDITARKVTENKLEENRRMLDSIFNAAPMAISVHDVSAQRPVFSNSTFAAELGYNLGEWEQLSSGPIVSALMHPADLSLFEEHLRQLEAAPAGVAIPFEFRMKSKAGDWLWFHGRDVVFSRDPAGLVEKILNVSVNITDRRRLEQAYQESEQRFRTALANSTVVVFNQDRELRYTWIHNPALGLRAEQVIGKTDHEIFERPEDANFTDSVKRRVIETGVGERQEATILSAGVARCYDCTVEPLRDGTGQIVGVTCAATDITERKQTEAKIQQHAVQLARANADLLHFVYAVSHDLQEPLRTVASYSQLLGRMYKGRLDGQADEFIKWITDASSRMSTLLRDLLSYARVAGEHAEVCSPVALEEALTIALKNLKVSIDEAQAQITHDPLPVVLGEAGQFTQLFQNLIGNSLKYRKPDVPPRVRISAEMKANEWVVSVEDNGVGFDPQHAERIFGVFERLRNKDSSGTGIGLAICKRIIDRFGGRIWASAELGKGALFSFSVLIAEAAWNRQETEEFSPALPASPTPEDRIVEPDFEELFHTLDLAQAMIFRLDGTILIWNRGAERLFGWSSDEAVGRSAYELLHTEFPKPLSEIEQDLLRDGEWTGELKKKKKDGSPLWVASHWALHRDGSGRPQSIIEVNTNITSEKQMEQVLRQSQNRFRQLVESSSVGILIGDLSGTLSYCNPAILRLIGYSEQDVAEGRVRWDQLTPPEFAHKDAEAVRQLLATGRCDPYEKVYIAKDGHRIPILLGGAVLDPAVDGASQTAAFVIDLTLLRRAEEALRRSGEQRDLALQAGQMGVWSFDTRTGVVEWSETIELMLGMEPGSFDGTLEGFMARVYPEDRALVQERVSDALNHGPEYRIEFRQVRLDGEICWVQGQGRVLNDEHGNATGLIGVVWDVTWRKRAEQSLKENEERLRLALAAARMGTWDVNVLTSEISWHGGLKSLYGLPEDGRSTSYAEFQALLLPEDRPLVDKAAQLAFSQDIDYDAEFRVVFPDGSIHWLAGKGKVIRDGSGRPVRMIGVNSDITDRKQAERELVEGGERLRFAADTARLGTWDLTLSTGDLECSPRCKMDLGLPEAGPLTLDHLWEAITSEDRQAVQHELESAVQQRTDLKSEFRVRRPGGELAWIVANGRALYASDGSPERVVGITVDVTDRKQAEANRQFLLDFSAKLTQISEPDQLVQMAVIQVSGYLGVARCAFTENEDSRSLEIFGEPVVASLRANRHVAVSDTRTDPRTAPYDESAYAPAGTRAFLAIPLHRDGVWRASFAAEHATPREWTEGDIALMRGVAERLWPVVENARLLQLTREKQAVFQATFEQAAVGMAHVGLDGRWLMVNRRLCDIVGYTKEELLALKFQDITYPEDLDADLKQYAGLKRGDFSSYSIEQRYFHKSGSTIWINLTVGLVRDSSGAPKYAVSVVEDITARKNDEQALRDSRELAGLRQAEIETLYESAPIGLAFFDADLRYIRVNQRLAEINGLAVADHLGRPLVEVLPDLAPKLVPILEGVLASGRPVQDLEIRGITPTRPKVERIWLTSYFPVTGRAAGVIGIHAVVQDITDRKKSEVALLETAERLQIATQSAGLGVFDWDIERDRIFWENQRMYEIFGRSRADGTLSGAQLLEVIHPQDADEFKKALTEAMQPGRLFRATCRIQRMDGVSRSLEFSGRVEFGLNGTPLHLVGVVVDITERAEAAARLQRSEHELLLALDGARLGLWSRDLASNTTLSEAAAGILGLRPGIVQPEDWFNCIHTDDLPAVTSALESALAGIEQYRAEYRFKPEGGRVRWVSSRGSLLRDDRGNPVRLIGVVQDITDRKDSEDALRESEEQLRSMIDSVSQLAWIARADGYIFWYNRRWYEFTGTTPEQMEGWGWQMVHDPKVLPEVMERWPASIRSGTRFEMEFPLRGADGVYRWFLTRVEPLRDSYGRIVRWFGTNTNIDDLRKSRELLEESERKFRELAESLPDLMWAAHADGSIHYNNPQWYAYTGFGPESDLGASWSSLIHPDDSDRFLKLWKEAQEKGKHFESESRIRGRDGIYRWFLNRAEPGRDEHGRVVKWFGTSTDIHEQKMTEDGLRRSNLDLEQFAYAASHDLQEPLRMVSIYTQMLAKKYQGKLDGDADQYILFAVNGAKRMEQLLLGLLEYSRVGDRAEKPATVFAEQGLKRALANLEGQIATSGAVVSSGALPAVSVPEVQLARLFENLIGNAIKYRSEAAPRIHISSTCEGAWCQFAVADNGIGFEPVYKEYVFGVFKRLYRDQYPGIGIGLAIAKRVVERYGGRIWVESDLGSGATFRFTLPAAGALE